MITEDYVSYEVAKLLKEKGFDEPCNSFYEYKKKLYIHDMDTYFPNGMKNSDHDKENNKGISAPTHQMACKWLREVHNLFIELYLPSHSEHEDTIYHGTYSFDIFNLNTKVYVYCTCGEKEFNSYEEAVEAALKYSLENLI